MSSTDKSYKVYKHTNLQNGKVYIGLTRQDPKRRWQNGAGYKDTYFGNAIKKYGWNGFSHEILAFNLTEKEAQDMEIALIAQYHSTDRNYGYNLSQGGEIMYCEPKYGKDNPRSQAINRIDPQSGDIVRFETLYAAANEMGINYRGISKACHGISRTYKGYIWEYADINYQKEQHCPIGKYDHINQRKKVLMIEPDGTEKVFNSLTDAGKEIDTRPNNISRYISGARKDSSGRRWYLCP